ncbi:MAG: transcriptional regulator, GntR family with aminotransferase domain [Herbinix sp.]|nr:transcriptional regulator, GntR family with aminotransferase domain [Herbinix sp.]
MDMLTFTLNPEDKTPLYHQLYTYIKTEIQAGKIPYQTKLPSKRKLSDYLKISQNTIQAAYDQLIEEGYIFPLERKGFFVNQIDILKKLTVPTDHDIPINKLKHPSVRYDFSYHGVDTPTFPYSIWRKLMKEVISEYDTELLIQSDSLGNLQLRNAISNYLHQSRGVNCSAKQIIISSGTEILFQSLIQLFDRDSIYGIENPGYEKLNQLFTSNRANFKAIAIDRMGMLPDEVRKNGANILCITPAHQFPSGEIMPINRRMQLLNFANEAPGRYLIEDDYDSEFKYSGKPVPALQGLDTNEKVIYMGSLSKSLSPTIRVSYMVLPLHLMKRYHEKLSFILCPVPIMEQKVLCRFMNEGFFERHLNKMRNIYKKKRDILVKCLLDLNCPIQISGADAGLHLLLSVHNEMTEDQLIFAALKKGIKVYGLSKYYLDYSYFDIAPTILIGYATMQEKDIINAVQLLSEAWF